MEADTKLILIGLVIVILISTIIGLIGDYFEEQTPPIVLKCEKVVCPLTSEVDCSKEVLDTINEAEVLKQTIKRIGG